MSTHKQESNFSHNFKMAAGGVACLLSACWNSLVARPAKRLLGRVSKQPQTDNGSFFGDLLGPE